MEGKKRAGIVPEAGILTIQVFSDYVCPYCFLAEVVLERVLRSKKERIKVEWMPFELRPHPTPTLLPEGEYLRATWDHAVYPMADSLGVPIVLPRVSPQPYTHLAFEGFQFANEQGLGNAYTDRVFRAFFQEEKDIGDVEVLQQLAGELALDTRAFKEALIHRTYQKKHREELAKAATVGVSAVPTFVVDGQIIRGLPDERSLGRLIASKLV